MGWEPGARPRPELVEAVLKQHGRADRREIGPMLWGVTLGALLGLLLKGLTGPVAGSEIGLIGQLAVMLGLAGLLASVILALVAALRAEQRPKLFQFAAINLLTLAIVQLV
nr:hypothetical protein [Phaeobacter sp. HF9A]